MALDSADFEELPEPGLYVLWVFRHNGHAPEFVGNITDFDDVDQAWDIPVNNAETFAISIEQAPFPAEPSGDIAFVGRRDLG